MNEFGHVRKRRAIRYRRHLQPHPLARVATLVATGIVLAACGGGSTALPSRTASIALPSRSSAESGPAQSSEPPVSPERSRTSERTAAPTRDTTTSAAEPTREQTPTRAASSPRTSAQPSTESVTTSVPRSSNGAQSDGRSSEQPTQQSSQPAGTPVATASEAAQAAQSDDGGTPAWVWWVLAATLVVIAAAVTWLVRSRHRRAAWTRDLSAATEEVVWFARVLLPQLGQAPTAAQLGGGWRIAVPRVVALEDRLTQLASTAPMDDEATRARTLRDAVRSARGRIDAALSMPDRLAADSALAATSAQLEAAMAHTRIGERPPQP